MPPSGSMRRVSSLLIRLGNQGAESAISAGFRHLRGGILGLPGAVSASSGAAITNSARETSINRGFASSGSIRDADMFEMADDSVSVDSIMYPQPQIAEAAGASGINITDSTEIHPAFVTICPHGHSDLRSAALSMRHAPGMDAIRVEPAGGADDSASASLALTPSALLQQSISPTALTLPINCHPCHPCYRPVRSVFF
ncbi:hypothetical protein VOLCADRAFT_107859 [Volvox carteri f. nagariensis]|uniref:Uncharacterized protein n=1 Tax=Volvox carteri f. nagariensis TaxID=3068 RepID=D8UGW9_VOLCA|nr:uncharacterized protein VOLCADRAFT_107859 [Volvox carteri f. nagariensis]EFJ41052.1 hypothetical protein VOLCADRAFT_107859 [Volvox carteri f. nagariensis]|eukprot:XP_002957916.1 hypothetical protein VOLCADRAFT_107859 [Volvox carteri f. nagariensis]